MESPLNPSITTASETKLSEGSLPNALLTDFATLVGGDAPQFMLALLVGLSGLSLSPVSARIVGSSDHIESVGLIVENLIDASRCRYLTEMSDSGVLSLEDQSLASVRCFAFGGDWSNQRLKQIVRELVIGRSVRTLDGSPTGWARYRAVNRRCSFLLLRADDLVEPAVVGSVLTIRLNRPVGTTQLQIRRDLNRFFNGSPKDWVEQSHPTLAQRIRQVAWETPVRFPNDIADFSKLRDQCDGQRICQVLSLASVWRLLREEPDAIADPLRGDTADVHAIIDLIEQSNGREDHERLSPRDSGMLLLLQQCRDPLARSQPNGSDGPFTFYNVHTRLPPPALSIDTVRLRFIALQNGGFLVPNGKLGHQRAYDLTEAGLAYQPISRAVFLRSAFQARQPSEAPHNSENSESPRSESFGATGGGSRRSESPESELRTKQQPQELI